MTSELQNSSGTPQEAFEKPFLEKHNDPGTSGRASCARKVVPGVHLKNAHDLLDREASAIWMSTLERRAPFLFNQLESRV